MLTVIETSAFQAQAAKIWSSMEVHDFIGWIAMNPEAGDVIPGTDGARKVRWGIKGRGKSGGARVIYVNLIDDGGIVLLTMYAKNVRENIPAREIKRL